MSTSSESKGKPRLLMLGDSLVADFSWQHHLTGFDVNNLGVPGSTTHDLLASISHLSPSHDDTRLIMVMIGTNDLAQEYYGLIHEYTHILQALSRRFPGAQIYVISLLPIRLHHLSQQAIIRLNISLSELCHSLDAYYIDLHSRFCQIENGLFQADGVHLTAKGYGLWVKTLTEHVAFTEESD